MFCSCCCCCRCCPVAAQEDHEELICGIQEKREERESKENSRALQGNCTFCCTDAGISRQRKRKSFGGVIATHHTIHSDNPFSHKLAQRQLISRSLSLLLSFSLFLTLPPMTLTLPSLLQPQMTEVAGHPRSLSLSPVFSPRFSESSNCSAN